MPFDTATDAPPSPAPTLLRPRGKAVLGASLLFAAAGLVTGNDLARLTLGLVALVLGAAGAWIWLLVRRADAAERSTADTVAEICRHDPLPAFLTGRDGLVVHANPAARAAFDGSGETTLAGLLQHEIAGCARVLDAVEREARASGAARRVHVRRDRVLRLSAHQVGGALLLWHVEQRAAGSEDGPPPLGLPVLTLDEDGHVLMANAAARTSLGTLPDTVDEICLRPPLRPGEVNDIRTARGPKPCLVVDAPRSDGRRDLVVVPDLPQAADSPDGWAFFDALPVPLLRLARDGRIQLSNRLARELLGIDSGEGRRLSDVLEGPGRTIADWLDDAAAGRGTVQPEILPVKRPDREVFVQVTLRPVAEQGEPALIAVLNDATKLKSLEAQFVQSQKMQAIGQLAGGVAHDFNNLLTAISGHCDLLLLRHDPDDADFADLAQINQNANRAAALVSQLLAYSRKQTMRPETLDLRDMLSELTHLLNRLVGEKVTLTPAHDPELWAVRADKRQLEQVVMNLVVNARDAMPDGGEIRITTANRVLDTPLRRDRAVVAPGRYVEVTVADDGIGMPPAVVEKVFDPFFTTKRPGEGTGLGLSTAYGIVKQTGGFIFVDSTPGEGTRFTLLLPAHDAVAETPRAEAPRIACEGRSDGVVLLVEDEAPVRAFASRALKMRGFSVLEAATGEEALEILADESLEIDVFVTDVILPGLDGPGWVRKALHERPGTQVIFVSGYAPETFADAEREIPNSVFLPKPFSLTELTETVQARLRG